MPATANYIEIVFWLLLVLAVILSLSWLVKRYSFLHPALNNTITVQAATSLGNRDRLAVVEVEGERILIAISPGRINTLHILGRSSFATTLQTVSGGAAVSSRNDRPDSMAGGLTSDV